MSEPSFSLKKLIRNIHFPAIDSTLAILFFWALAFVVFVQFFTRYVLNNSLGWTEEIARYLLILVSFTGSAIAVRRNTHISIEFFYRYLPHGFSRILSTLVDFIRIGLLAAMTWLCIELMGNTRQMMTSIDMPKSVLYGAVAVCFMLMTAYSIIVAIRHFREGKTDVSPDVPTDLDK